MILKIYTEEGFLYRRVNKILRDKNYNEFTQIKYYYFALIYSLQNVEPNPETHKSLYRGLKLKADQAILYNTLIKGQILMFNEFLSTTFDEAIALKYARTGPGSLIFDIEIPMDTKIAQIDRYSRFQYEKEVLFASGANLVFNESIDENDVTRLKFVLVTSNCQALCIFIHNYQKNSIDFTNIRFGYDDLEKVFKILNKHTSIIQNVCFMVYESNLISLFARHIAANNTFKITNITKYGEIVGKRTIVFTRTCTSYLFIKNFSYEDNCVFASNFLRTIKDTTLYPYFSANLK